MTTKVINVYADKINVSTIGQQVGATVVNVDLGQLLQEFSIQEVLEAIKDNDHFSDMVDFVTKELKDDE